MGGRRRATALTRDIRGPLESGGGSLIRRVASWERGSHSPIRARSRSIFIESEFSNGQGIRFER